MSVILENLIQPLARRFGTAAGAAFLTFGATTQQADSVETAVFLLIGVGWDLALSHFSRKLNKAKAIEAVFKGGL